MKSFETFFAEMGKLIDDFITERRGEVRLERPTTQEVESKIEAQPIEVESPINAPQEPKRDKRECVSDKAEIMLKKAEVIRPRQTYSSINFFFTLRDGNTLPKGTVRNDSFLNRLHGHIQARSKYGMSHKDLWNEIGIHYSCKALKGEMYSRSQAEGLVGYLYLEKGMPLNEAFEFIDKNYVKGISYADASSIIVEVTSKKSKGRPRKYATIAREALINFGKTY